jgi:hypothetical protein
MSLLLPGILIDLGSCAGLPACLAPELQQCDDSRCYTCHTPVLQGVCWGSDFVTKPYTCLGSKGFVPDLIVMVIVLV